MTNKKAEKRAKQYTEAIEILKEFRKRLKKYDSVLGMVDYKIGEMIITAEKNKAEYSKQSVCKHANTTGLVYTGHTSHENCYENTCKDCGKILETEWQ